MSETIERDALTELSVSVPSAAVDEYEAIQAEARVLEGQLATLCERYYRAGRLLEDATASHSEATAHFVWERSGWDTAEGAMRSLARHLDVAIDGGALPGETDLPAWFVPRSAAPATA